MALCSCLSMSPCWLSTPSVTCARYAPTLGAPLPLPFTTAEGEDDGASKLPTKTASHRAWQGKGEREGRSGGEEKAQDGRHNQARIFPPSGCVPLSLALLSVSVCALCVRLLCFVCVVFCALCLCFLCVCCTV